MLDAGTSVALVGDGDGCDPTVQRLPIPSPQRGDPRLLPRPDFQLYRENGTAILLHMVHPIVNG